MKFLEKTFEIIGWIRIVTSMILSGSILGVLAYAFIPDTTLGFITAIILLIIFTVIGIRWATRVWKKQGTLSFLSEVDRAKELDKKGILNKNYED